MKKEILNELINECKSCYKCELGKTRTNIVFADGNPETAKAILIGEAPGENEDKTGTPFVGRAGKLLNEFLVKAGITRAEDLYIINMEKITNYICENPDKFSKDDKTCYIVNDEDSKAVQDENNKDHKDENNINNGKNNDNNKINCYNIFSHI